MRNNPTILLFSLFASLAMHSWADTATNGNADNAYSWREGKHACIVEQALGLDPADNLETITFKNAPTFIAAIFNCASEKVDYRLRPECERSVLCGMVSDCKDAFLGADTLTTRGLFSHVLGGNDVDWNVANFRDDLTFSSNMAHTIRFTDQGHFHATSMGAPEIQSGGVIGSSINMILVMRGHCFQLEN